MTDSLPKSWRRASIAASSSSCRVRGDVDTIQAAIEARSANVAGIGLCRAERMLVLADRLLFVRSILMTSSAEGQKQELEEVRPLHQKECADILRIMSPLPVTFRLIDRPLSGFLPTPQELKDEIHDARLDEDWDRALFLETTRHRLMSLHEANPTMGHRGCRLSITYPEILRMQIRAILGAALDVVETGLTPTVEIMVPMVSCEEEIQQVVGVIHETAAQMLSHKSQRIHYRVGAMIEIPRAIICAGAIARHVDFISFGTNDLTQMTYGFSREDSGTYLSNYLRLGILTANPFVSIDPLGVGFLMGMAIRAVREANPDIEIGVCGDHTSDPDSIAFFQKLGVDYLCCTPERVPAVRKQLERHMGSPGENARTLQRVRQ